MRDGTLTTRTNMAGGGIMLRGRVSTHPTRALLTVRSAQRLAPAPCIVRMFRDGEALTVHESERASDYQLRLAIDVAALRQLHDSMRFVIEGCGRSIVLDEPARVTLSEFEARFREERSKLHDGPSAVARAR